MQNGRSNGTDCTDALLHPLTTSATEPEPSIHRSGETPWESVLTKHLHDFFHVQRLSAAWWVTKHTLYCSNTPAPSPSENSTKNAPLGGRSPAAWRRVRAPAGVAAAGAASMDDASFAATGASTCGRSNTPAPTAHQAGGALSRAPFKVSSLGPRSESGPTPSCC